MSVQENIQLFEMILILHRCFSAFTHDTQTCQAVFHIQSKSVFAGFPGGSVVKNPPTSAGDRGSIPGPARSHVLWSSEAHGPQLLRLWAWEPRLVSSPAGTSEACSFQSLCSVTRSPCNEKSTHHNWTLPPRLEKSPCRRRPSTAKSK